MSSFVIDTFNKALQEIVKQYPVPKDIIIACCQFNTCSDEIIKATKVYLCNLINLIYQYNSGLTDVSQMIYLESIPENVKLTRNIPMFRDGFMRIGLINPKTRPPITCFAISSLDHSIKIDNLLYSQTQF